MQSQREAQFTFLFQTLLIPYYQPLKDGKSFAVSAWVGNLSDAQLKRAEGLLFWSDGKMERDGYQNGWWVGEKGFDKREDAMDAQCKLAKELFNVLGNESLAVSA